MILPTSTDFVDYTFLCLDCTLENKQKLDEEEDIEVKLIDLVVWMDMVYKIQANNGHTIVTTLLAKPHLEAIGML